MECGTTSEPMDAKEVMQQTARAAAYTLEAGIVFHSLFVGISLGTSQEAAYVQGLAIALIFHQVLMLLHRLSGFSGLHKSLKALTGFSPPLHLQCVLTTMPSVHACAC